MAYIVSVPALCRWYVVTLLYNACYVCYVMLCCAAVVILGMTVYVLSIVEMNEDLFVLLNVSIDYILLEESYDNNIQHLCLDKQNISAD